jgi:hypothetical protein
MRKYEARIVSSSMMIIPRFMKIGWVIQLLLRRGHTKTENNTKALVRQFQKATAHSFTACNNKYFQKAIFKVILQNLNSWLKKRCNYLAIMLQNIIADVVV